MKLLKLESGSRSGPNTGERNSVSRARCKRQSKDLMQWMEETSTAVEKRGKDRPIWQRKTTVQHQGHGVAPATPRKKTERSEEHTSELQSRGHLVCRLLLEKK